ncbi:MAG: hypothetical protein E7314_04075 [Clostridiales bacterium]|nr:hypothetical protein [Clostridiales bacterium]
MKKVIIVASILAIVLAIVLTVFLVINLNKSEILITYEDSLVSYKIYSNGKIRYSSEYGTDRKKITEEELEELNRLINIRVADNEALSEDIELNKRILSQDWKCEAYYNEQYISLNYNFADSNVELVEYIWKLEDKYFRG